MPPSRRKVVLVLPVYGAFDYAALSASSFLESTEDSGVLWIDDASPEPAPERQLEVLNTRYGDRLEFRRLPSNVGVTRVWESGLELADALGFEFAICGNSDVFCPKGFWRPIEALLRGGWDLVGPLTNAPGSQNPERQHIRSVYREYAAGLDDPAYLRYVVEWLRDNAPADVLEVGVNGFFMASRVDRWLRGKLENNGFVFNPAARYRMVGSEDELQARWRSVGARIGVSLRSFVFHYRSVTRGDRHLRGDWHRRRDSVGGS